MERYQQEAQEVLRSLNTSEAGLSGSEAAQRLAKHGPNELAEGKKITLFERFVSQLKDPMIIILLAAALISGVTAAYSGESFTDHPRGGAHQRRAGRVSGEQGREGH